MGDITPRTEQTWQATSIASSGLADAGSLTTGDINAEGADWTQVSIDIAYGGTANEGVKAYILKEKDDGTFQTANDGGTFLEALEYQAGQTRSLVKTIDKTGIFRVHLTNDSGASVTATVKFIRRTGATTT